MSVTLRQEAPGGWEVWQPWQVSVACHTGQDVERELPDFKALETTWPSLVQRAGRRHRSPVSGLCPDHP